MSTFTVAIAGLTGKFARCVSTHLLEHPQVHIKGYCRNPNKLPKNLRSNPRVTVFKGEATDAAAIREVVHQADVAICCYLGDNTLMTEGQKILIDACIAEGVPRYIASDYALDYRKLELGQVPAKDPMKHVQAYLETRKEIEGVHVLIGCFMETFWGFSGTWDAKNVQFNYWGNGDERWDLTTYDNAAQYVAAVALDKSATGFLQFRGDQRSIREVAEDFKTVYQQEAKLEARGTLDELFKTIQAERACNPHNFYPYLSLLYAYYITNGQTLLKEKSDNGRYPEVKPLTVRDFLEHTEQNKLSRSVFF